MLLSLSQPRDCRRKGRLAVHAGALGLLRQHLSWDSEPLASLFSFITLSSNVRGHQPAPLHMFVF